MPFVKPTLPQLEARTDAEVESRLGTGPLLRRSVLRVLSRVLAGASYLLHLHLDWSSRQFLPDTAEGAELERLATQRGISRKGASRAGGSVRLSGAAGSDVPQGTELRRSDGVAYRTSAGATIAGGLAEVAATAALAGAAGNCAGATALTLARPLAGVQSAATVSPSGMSGGADEETDDELRGRVLQDWRAPRRGGAEPDYVRWALEVPGVTRAWAFKAHLGLGTVGLGFTVDDDPAGPIPSAAKVDEVRAYLEDGRRPATADLFVFAPVAHPVNLTISLVPDTPEVRAAVLSSLGDLMRREGKPGEFLPVSHLREAISTSTGEIDHLLTAPTGDVLLPKGHLPVLGTVTWT